MENRTSKIKITVHTKQYSEAFIKSIVKEYEKGILNRDQIPKEIFYSRQEQCFIVVSKIW